MLNNVGQRVMFDLRTELFTKLQQQEVAYYDHYPVGRIMTRLTSDVDALNELFTSGVIDVLGDLVVIFAIVGIMFWLDWKLALVSLVTVPLLFVATNCFVNTRVTALTVCERATRGSTRFFRNISRGLRLVSYLMLSRRRSGGFTTSTTTIETRTSRRSFITRFFIRLSILSAPWASRS
jgi:ABC-type multidrug transport system fused ATPase/permease subunit